MKKILFFSLVLIFGVTGISRAQLQEGTFMLGADFGSGITTTTSNGLVSMNFGLNEGAGFNLGISPKAGYFFNDIFVLGAAVNLGYTKSPSSDGDATHTTVYGIQPFARLYFSQEEDNIDNLLNHSRFFVEANAGIAGVNIKDGPTTNGFAFGFGPGYSYFVTSTVALEATAKYNGLVGGGNTTYQHGIGLNFGIKVFIPSSRVENRVENMDERL